MAAAPDDSEPLFVSTNVSPWRTSYQCYPSVIKELALQKEKKSSKSKKVSLLELDTWYQNELPVLISSRKEPHLKHEELCKLMAWKLTRGKFRPRLTELVRENSPESVESITRKAISLLPNLKKAVEHVCQLRGVGPATASAVLCAAAPERVPFMADEVVMAVPGLGKLEYTLGHYISFADAINEKARQLAELEEATDGTEQWTAHRVELALWAHHFAQRLNPELLKRDCETAHKGRKRTNELNEVSPRTKKSKQ